MRRKSMCFPLRTVAFRGHGFSLLEQPSLRGLQTRAIPAGVNGPPLQTTIVIVKASYCTVVKHYVSATEIHEDSLKKNTAFSACDVSQRSIPCPAGKRVYFQSGMLRRSSLYTLCQKQQLFSMG